jgi:tRNA (adenine22-N1)-methyltransferase
MPALSARLEAVLALLMPCRRLIDVGTDHGLIPISAVQRGIAARAIASDLRHAPLVLARRNILAARLSEQILLLREDGLSALANGAVDAVVMAGMSGEQMVRLCSEASHVLERVSQLLVQPNSDVHAVRRWARAHGWQLRDESMLIERGQFFVTCAFEPASCADTSYQVPGFSEADLFLVGPLLLARRDPTALRFYEWQCQRLGLLVERQVATMQGELRVWQAARAFIEDRAPG